MTKKFILFNTLAKMQQYCKYLNKTVDYCTGSSYWDAESVSTRIEGNNLVQFHTKTCDCGSSTCFHNGWNFARVIGEKIFNKSV